MQQTTDSEVTLWFERRTLPSYGVDPTALADKKAATAQRISVCLPALNEERTVGEICRAIRSAWMGRRGLVDELIVMDTGSNDTTVAEADRAGGFVYRTSEVLPDLGQVAGKGEALWKSLAVLTGDIIVWLDSDVIDFDPSFVASLVAPLDHRSIALTKGFYERPALPDAPDQHGGRITELTVSPLLNLLFPSLSQMIQPLAGEYAIRREAAIRLPFFTDYAVDVGLLIDCARSFGLDSLAQVDLGRRAHRMRDTLALGRAAHEIVRALLTRAAEAGRLELSMDLPTTFVQFGWSDDGLEKLSSDRPIVLRPPMAEVLPATIGHNG